MHTSKATRRHQNQTYQCHHSHYNWTAFMQSDWRKCSRYLNAKPLYCTAILYVLTNNDHTFVNFIFQVFTQLYIECATVFGMQKLHCLIKIHTNLLSVISLLMAQKGPKHVVYYNSMSWSYNRTDFKCILWDASIYVMHGKYGKY